MKRTKMFLFKRFYFILLINLLSFGTYSGTKRVRHSVVWHYEVCIHETASKQWELKK